MATTAVQPPSDALKKILSGAGELPVLPDTAFRIMEEMKSPQVNARRMAEFVSKDPVLASAVLRVANSAIYGGRTETTDLAYAMVRIGLQQVRNLVLALVLRSRMADPQVYGSMGARLMEHALAVAFASRLVADDTPCEPDQAFLCGLLHDFGRLALIKALREANAIRKGDLPADLMDLVDANHEEAGAMLAASWRLPDSVAFAARYHHRPEAAPEHREIVAAVAYANILAHHLGLGGPQQLEIDIYNHPAVGILDLRKEKIDDLAGHLPGLVQAARAAMMG